MAEQLCMDWKSFLFLYRNPEIVFKCVSSNEPFNLNYILDITVSRCGLVHIASEIQCYSSAVIILDIQYADDVSKVP